VVPGAFATGVETAGFRTDAAGRFHITDLPPGSAVVSVSHPGYARAVTEALTLVSASATVHQIVLHPGGAIHGRAVNDRRLPVAGIEIELRTPSDPMPQRGHTRPNGTFNARTWRALENARLVRAEGHLEGNQPPERRRVRDGQIGEQFLRIIGSNERSRTLVGKDAPPRKRSH
jgi:hypothetical protein